MFYFTKLRINHCIFSQFEHSIPLGKIKLHNINLYLVMISPSKLTLLFGTTFNKKVSVKLQVIFKYIIQVYISQMWKAMISENILS